MQKETTLDGVEAFTQKRRQKHQVVIVHPHLIVITAHHFHQLIRETLIRRDVRLPLMFLKSRIQRRHRQDVVHQRPQILFTEPLIKVLLGIFGQKHRHRIKSRL